MYLSICTREGKKSFIDCPCKRYAHASSSSLPENCEGGYLLAGKVVKNVVVGWQSLHNFFLSFFCTQPPSFCLAIS